MVGSSLGNIYHQHPIHQVLDSMSMIPLFRAIWMGLHTIPQSLLVVSKWYCWWEKSCTALRCIKLCWLEGFLNQSKVPGKFACSLFCDQTIFPASFSIWVFGHLCSRNENCQVSKAFKKAVWPNQATDHRFPWRCVGQKCYNSPLPLGEKYANSSWWFQPIWKIWVKMGIFPK